MAFLPYFSILLVFLHTAASQDRPFEGMELTFTMTDTIAENLYRVRDEWEELTGSTIVVNELPFDQLFPSILSDLQDGSPVYDGFVFPPPFLVDFIECDGCSLLTLSDRVRESAALAWHDVFPYFRTHNSVYDREVYTVTLDGDVHYLYYNIDILNALDVEVPNTWEEYLEISKLAHGRDWNGDGEPDFGSCIPRAPDFQGPSFLSGVVSSFMQSRGSTQGIYFDVETMEPLVKTEGFAEGLDMYMRLAEYGPDENFDLLDMFQFMAEGRCAFAPTWANVGPISRDTRGLNTSTWDKIGASINPGSSRAFDYQEDRWYECTEGKRNECPFADLKGVNHAPFAANGGWSGAIPANLAPERQDAVFEFYAFLSSKSNEAVVTGAGFDPYRGEHLNLTLWIESGFNEVAAQAQIEGLEETLRSNNLVIDLRISGAFGYVNVALDGELFKLNTGQISQRQFMDNVYDLWEEITDTGVGRRVVLQQYRATLGLAPKEFEEEIDVTVAGRIAFAVIAGILALCCVGLIIFVAVHRQQKVWLYASPAFLYASLVGAIIAYIGIILMSADASTGTCTSALWLFVVGLAIILGNIFAKTYRTWQLFRYRKKFFVNKMRDIDIVPIAVVVVFFAIVILAVWTGVDAPTAHESTKGVGDLEFVVICDSTDSGLAFFATTIAYFGILLLIALIFSFNTRHAGDAFNESKTLGLCVYNLAQVLIIVVVSALALDDPDGRYILVVICLTFGVTVTIGLLFVPKVYTTLRGKGNDVGTSTSTRQSQYYSTSNERTTD